jgi:hypothetical protein
VRLSASRPTPNLQKQASVFTPPERWMSSCATGHRVARVPRDRHVPYPLTWAPLGLNILYPIQILLIILPSTKLQFYSTSVTKVPTINIKGTSTSLSDLSRITPSMWTVSRAGAQAERSNWSLGLKRFATVPVELSVHTGKQRARVSAERACVRTVWTNVNKYHGFSVCCRLILLFVLRYVLPSNLKHARE